MDKAAQGNGVEGTIAAPSSWTDSQEAQDAFWAKVRSMPQATLIVDYDGTLAPFQDDKMQAVPFPGVTERLLQLVTGPTRLAFVTGRPVAELITLLPLAADAELWGMHGREHRTPDGKHALLTPTAAQCTILDKAYELLEAARLGALLERKIASIAVHWRAAAEPYVLEKRAHELLAPLAGQNALALLPFDGGLELRAEDHSKGHAVHALLQKVDASAAAYLGDDTTDEDAFRAINARGGLSLLVRTPPRVSSAQFHLKPPGDLLQFLDQWIEAAGTKRSGTPR